MVAGCRTGCTHGWGSVGESVAAGGKGEGEGSGASTKMTARSLGCAAGMTC